MDELSMHVNSIVMSDESFNKTDLNSSVNFTYSALNIASNVHPRLDIYKKRINTFKSSQDERRRQILSIQKKKRESLIEAKRIDTSNENKHEQLSHKKSKRYSVNPQYVNQLMFSEWLEDKPNDFETNWIMVICPVGKRCLVVASQGCTSVYNKAGKLISRHASRLPGATNDTRADETILDCIYSDILGTYFVIDCLCWKSHPITDSETEFRFYWLGCKLNEFSNVQEVSLGTNPYPFKNVIRIENLTDLKINSAFSKKFDYEVDGVLFFHKEGHYSSGHTPLVGWLKPYMIPEILNIPMPEWIKVPSDYAGFRQEINESNIQREQLQTFLNNNTVKHQINDIEVDCETPNPNFNSVVSKEENNNILENNVNFVNNKVVLKTNLNKNHQITNDEDII